MENQEKRLEAIRNGLRRGDRTSVRRFDMSGFGGC